MCPIDFEITQMLPNELSNNYFVFELKEEIMKGKAQTNADDSAMKVGGELSDSV